MGRMPGVLRFPFSYRNSFVRAMMYSLAHRIKAVPVKVLYRENERSTPLLFGLT